MGLMSWLGFGLPVVEPVVEPVGVVESVEPVGPVLDDWGVPLGVNPVREVSFATQVAYDNLGWAAVGCGEVERLQFLKDVSARCRNFFDHNTFIKRGVNARVSYVFGGGVKFDNVESFGGLIGLNRGRLFSSAGMEECEKVLATDGNLFFGVPIVGDVLRVLRFPLSEIVGYVCNPVDSEDVWYFKRTFKVTDLGSGEVRVVTRFYPSMSKFVDVAGGVGVLRTTIGDVVVDSEYVVQHVAVNRQVGDVLGMPDVAPALFWAKGYAEYLQDLARLVKIYSQLAFSVQVSSSKGGQQAAAQVALQGESVGGSAVSGPGTALKQLPPVGASIDFDKGSALAAAVASSLEVSKLVITSDPGGSNRSGAESLDLPTLTAMKLRQLVHSERFLELFNFWSLTRFGSAGGVSLVDASDAPAVVWAAIQSDTVKDTVTSVALSVEVGAIDVSEARAMFLDVFNITPLLADGVLPERPSGSPVVAAQGVSGGLSAAGGAQTDSNRARDARGVDKNNV